MLSCADKYLGESSSRDCSIVDTIQIAVPSKFILDGMDLRRNGIEGKFFDRRGNLIALDPSVRSPGPHSLLVREDAFVEFMRKEDCDLLWTLLGEKQVLGGRMSPTDWKGRLEVSGAFRL